MDASARQVIADTAKAHAHDYYLSALLAPRDVRDDLLVLAAFEGELDRIPAQVSEPLVSEIRLQWWRDWIEAIAPGTNSGNPLADALAAVVLRHGLDKADLCASVDARSELDENWQRLPLLQIARSRYLARDAAAMLRAASLLGVIERTERHEGLRNAGLALSYARMALATRAGLGHGTGLLLDLKSELQQARHNLMAARADLPGWSRSLRLAALPLALVEPYLRACESGVAASQDGREVDPASAILPLSRVWRLWWFAKTGRL